METNKRLKARNRITLVQFPFTHLPTACPWDVVRINLDRKFSQLSKYRCALTG